MRVTTLIVALSGLLTQCSHPNEPSANLSSSEEAIRFVHYNIKELTTRKLIGETGQDQVDSAINNLYYLQPDILSINELQYDIKDVPLVGTPGGGKNMHRILELMEEDASQWDVNFAQANTGNLAKRKPDGNFPTETYGPEANEYGDPINFGIFPGQYSTGLASRYNIIERKVNASIRWKQWDKNIDLEGFELPDDMLLFDKNFNDTTIEIDGVQVHIITFHTVPAFDFGNANSPNYVRNQAQLEFLEWYLLGECESNSVSAVKSCDMGPKPLGPKALFIAVGDLNVDYRSNNPGAKVLRRMFEGDRVQNSFAENKAEGFRVDGNKSHITYLQDGADLNKLQSHLDYFLVSKQIDIVSAEVYSPDPDFKEHRCYKQKNAAESKRDQVANQNLEKSVQVSRRFGAAKPYCVISVSEEFAEFRNGSDHLPVELNFNLSE